MITKEYINTVVGERYLCQFCLFYAIVEDFASHFAFCGADDGGLSDFTFLHLDPLFIDAMDNRGKRHRDWQQQ